MRLPSPLFMALPLLSLLFISCQFDVELSARVGQEPHDGEVTLASDDAAERKLRAQPLHEAPKQLYVVTKVVDGDTIHIEREGVTEKLRLLSVDTEEVIRSGGYSSETKPQTVFGDKCAEWAKEFFVGQAGEDGVTRVGLWFPGDTETRDIYGRLLCHVVLSDGTDFNLLLLEEGKSPYFNKYGNSTEFDAEFRAAQSAARAASIGIWDPKTNQATTPDQPSAKRPYDILMPWWESRARAIDEYRVKHAADPLLYVDAGDPEQLEAVTRAAKKKPTTVEVFGAPDRVFDEKDGSKTVLFRTSDRKRALRVRIPKDAIAAHAELELEDISEELRQNYVWVKGPLRWTGRGYEFTSGGVDAWRIAAPQGQN